MQSTVPRDVTLTTYGKASALLIHNGPGLLAAPLRRTQRGKQIVNWVHSTVPGDVVEKKGLAATRTTTGTMVATTATGENAALLVHNGPGLLAVPLSGPQYGKRRVNRVQPTVP